MSFYFCPLCLLPSWYVYLQQFLYCSFVNCHFKKLIIFAIHTMTIFLLRYITLFQNVCWPWLFQSIQYSYLVNSPLNVADQSRLPRIRTFHWWAFGFSALSGARQRTYGRPCISCLLVMLLALPFACFLLVGMSAKTITSTYFPLSDTDPLFWARITTESDLNCRSTIHHYVSPVDLVKFTCIP